MKLHTFSICAYKESAHLESCIQSLLPQREYSELIMCTSTPNRHISGLAEKYGIPLFVRDGKSDIQDDWNFACRNARTPWVTVTHQDDVYVKDYARELTARIQERPDAIFAFTDYKPLKNGRVTVDLNCVVKRILHAPMRSKRLAASKKWKRRILRFGNTINCPSCAYNKTLFKGEIFNSTLKFALDWDTFVVLAETEYPFIYIPKDLVYYRIHNEATSMSYTDSLKRKEDEYYMFRKFWPEKFIDLYYHVFKLSYKTYSYREDVLAPRDHETQEDDSPLKS